MTRGWNKDIAKQNILRFNNAITSEQTKAENFIDDRLKQTLQYYDELLSQIPLSMTGPLLSKTPKPVKKRTKRIMTIPEDEVASLSKDDSSKVNDNIEEDLNNLKKTTRQSKKVLNSTHAIKTDLDDVEENSKVRRTTRNTSKRMNDNLLQSTAEENVYSPKVKKIRLTRKQTESNVQELEDVLHQEEVKDERRNNTFKSSTARSLTLELEETLNEFDTEHKNVNTTISKKSEDKPNRKRTNHKSPEKVISKMPRNNEPSVKKPNLEGGRESNDISLYEDAIEKHNIMSSTMNASALLIHKKIMNPLVILEPLSTIPMTMKDETFVVPNKVQKSKSNSLKKTQSLEAESQKVESLKKSSFNSSADSLMTDDESDNINIQKTKKTRVLRSSLLSDDDEVVMTPPAPPIEPMSKAKTIAQNKNNFKNGALFSPYMKESVKKRVEAFEQVVAASPQNEVVGTMRVTRTKTRALAAGTNTETTDSEEPKKKHEETDDEEEEDTKENNIKKKTEKLKKTRNTHQLKYVTPIGKNRIPVPTSTSKLYTPSNSSTTHLKPLTATRHNNLVSNLESFIPKSVSKINSADKSDEKRRKMSTDDAKLKREIQLKTMAEEKKKKREMKERKIRETREAKERLEMEKRLKTEKEKEEKAKLAMLAQEKAREEAEKKRLLYQQRMQEKEERRKQEYLLRQQKIQEQEELERQLAEQRRHEQEIEKKRLAEIRAYQQAQAESLKLKMLAKKQVQAQKVPNTYKLESEPDDDSDYESNPKHPIPDWASASIRSQPLIAQSYIPKQTVMRLFNTRRCTPDLSQLFEGISKHRLKRTSSAIWKSPPSYSLMCD